MKFLGRWRMQSTTTSGPMVRATFSAACDRRSSLATKGRSVLRWWQSENSASRRRAAGWKRRGPTER